MSNGTRSKPLVTSKPSAMGVRNFYADNGLLIGRAYQEVDGYFVFDHNTALRGYQNEYMLYAIADELRMLNREWDKTVGRDPAIGGSPDYSPPATMAEMQSYMGRFVAVLKKAAADNAVHEGVRKMEGLTKPQWYPWMKPVHQFMSELLALLKENHEQ